MFGLAKEEATMMEESA